MIVITEETLEDLDVAPPDESPEARAERLFLRHQAYCGLDCCVPLEAFEILEPRLDEDTRQIYEFEVSCLKAALTMSLRGVLVDPERRAELIGHYSKEQEDAAKKVGELAVEVWDKRVPRVGRCTLDGDVRLHHRWPRGVEPAEASCSRCGASRLVPAPVNPGSHDQVAHLFYDLWRVRPRRNRDQGITVDKEAMESIRGEYTNKDPAIAAAANECIKAKLAQKQVGYARARIDEDGRYRHSANVGAAETGRWSASKSPGWTGGNIQQISDRLRGMFIADPGLEIFYADLEQAESKVVAYDSGDPAYMEVHELSDPHTAVCKLVWPELSWPGGGDWRTVLICNAPEHQSSGLCCDRGLADTCPDWDPFHAYRDYAKRIQHGGNMGRTPQGVARQIHVSVAVAQEVYARMYGGRRFEAGELVFDHGGAFPLIKARHRQIGADIARTGLSISCLGRRRQYLGRTWDDDTLREALGQLEQSPVADILNLALCRVWKELDTRPNVFDFPHPSQPNRVWLLAQVHDAILGLVRPGDLDTLRRVRDLMTIPFWIEGRLCTIGVEIAVGHSWAKKELRKVKL